jgi:hypothetical protein
MESRISLDELAVPPGFTLSSTAVTIASPGPSATSTITISPSGGFTGSAALSCSVTGGPKGGAGAPTCSVTAPPAIVGAAAVTATFIVSTTAASTAANGYSVSRNQHPPAVLSKFAGRHQFRRQATASGLFRQFGLTFPDSRFFVHLAENTDRLEQVNER